MGSCFSSSSTASLPPTAKVVSLKGDLREYAPPVSVAQVLMMQSDSTADYFLCNSDFLSYDEPIPALRSDALLVPNQLYFLLPVSKLHSRLTAPEMAALAVRASEALQSNADRGGRKKSSISPLFLLHDGDNSHRDQYDESSHLTLNSSQKKPNKGPALQPGGPFTRSGSIRKLQRYASKRAKLAVRSFRFRLVTIYEGTVL